MQAPCHCAEVNAATDNNEDRVGLIADAAPDCECEAHSMSTHSPGPVQSNETIGRMVCVPLHVHKKKPELLPSFFSHAFSVGMSAQRLEVASASELAEWVNEFVSGSDNRVWLGYVQATCKSIRDIERVDKLAQAFCAYDAALEQNPAHVEVCASSRVIEDADRIEARTRLRRAFANGQIVSRNALKDGSVRALVKPELLTRECPAQWQTLAE